MKHPIVVKIGGGALVDPGCGTPVIDRLADISSSHNLVVVVSAFRGLTDALLGIGRKALEWRSTLEQVRFALEEAVRSAAGNERLISEGFRSDAFDDLVARTADEYGHACTKGRPPEAIYDILGGFGERLALAHLATSLRRRGFDPGILDAGEFIVTDEVFTHATVEADATFERFAVVRDRLPSLSLLAGFIGRSRNGRSTTLGRNASDVSAAYAAVGVGAMRLEIWTDSHGIMSADPGWLAAAKTHSRLHFAEAQAMSIVGAKVLHPQTLPPLRSHHGELELAVRSYRSFEALTEIAPDDPTWSPRPLAIVRTGRPEGLEVDIVGAPPRTLTDEFLERAGFRGNLTRSIEGLPVMRVSMTSSGDRREAAMRLHEGIFGQ